MADEPTKPTDPNTASGPKDSATAAPPAEALADGTVPTVLAPGETHRPVPKSQASITRIYRRADIMTTLFTVLGIIVAGAIIVGAYYYFAVIRAPKPQTTSTKVTQLTQEDLQKLGAYFSGNTAGGTNQTLTISSSTLFSGRVAMSSDLKVLGGLEVSGPTTLSDLTTNKTSNLGVTNVRGQLTVAGPLTVQSPATLSSGGTVTGNLTVSGNGSFGGTISAGTVNATNASINGTLNLGGHLSITGSTPSAGPAPSGTAGSGAAATVEGNDSSGTVTISTGAGPAAGQLVTLTFRTAYPRAPHILITPIGAAAGALQPYILKGATSFTIGVTQSPAAHTSYGFEYWVVQ